MPLKAHPEATMITLLLAALLSSVSLASEDYCADSGWYGDGICDEDCAKPDPDCESDSDSGWSWPWSTGSDELSGSFSGGGDVFLDLDTEDEDEDDFCADSGWYGDGICDPDCPEPDPDCESGGDDSEVDYCEAEGWYGDGICDEGCAKPDPDCA